MSLESRTVHKEKHRVCSRWRGQECVDRPSEMLSHWKNRRGELANAEERFVPKMEKERKEGKKDKKTHDKLTNEGGKRVY